MENLESYIATIDELVDDENKIVTYKSLSQQLALPAHKAKEVLQLYIKSNETGKISAMYSLTGRTKRGILVTIVSEADLEHAKSQVDSISSCLPYSVQKAKLLDPSPLYAVDCEMTRKILHQCASFSKIQFNGAKTLTEAEIQQRRFSKPAESTKPTEPDKTNNTSEPPKKSTQKKASISLFMSNKPNKADKPSSEDKESPEEKQANSSEILKPVKPKPTRKKVGMDTFMTKGKTDLFKQHKPPTSAPLSPANENTPPPSSTTDEHNILLNDDKLKELSEEMDIDEVPEPKEEDANEAKNETCKKVRKKQLHAKSKPKKSKPSPSTNDQPAKRRRRIRELSSSSESEPEEDFDEMDVIPPSPVVSPPPPRRSGLDKNPRKKRVLKSRTFFDADGSMLTEKVWEEVSCSSGEDDDVIKKENKTPPEPEKKSIFKQKPVVKGKQSSLMGFFSKKT